MNLCYLINHSKPHQDFSNHDQTCNLLDIKYCWIEQCLALREQGDISGLLWEMSSPPGIELPSVFWLHTRNLNLISSVSYGWQSVTAEKSVGFT